MYDFLETWMGVRRRTAVPIVDCDDPSLAGDC